MDKGEFQGRQAIEHKLERGPARKLSCITLEDPAAVVLGKEPIRADGAVVGYVTSAGYGYSVGRCVVYGYLPTELAVEGTPLEIEYFDERLPARVASEPLWDPKGERLRA
jgi:glycine cleavage system aminomethyltransferase T